MAILPSVIFNLSGRATLRVALCALVYCLLVAVGYPDSEIHRMVEGETLEGLAKTYLGGAEFAEELRSFNSLPPQEVPKAGFLIAIPGPVRNEAQKQLGIAGESFRRAVDAQAKRFAPAEFENAEHTVTAARAAMSNGVYCQVVALSELAVNRADLARRVADEHARVPRDAVAVAVGGQVEFSVDNGVSWRVAEPATRFPVETMVRTGPGARIAMRLDDGSQLTLAENGAFNFRDYITDLRNGEVNALLAVPRGGIEGAVPMNPGHSSRTILQAGRAVNVLKGTTLRARVDEAENTYTEVLQGHADVEFEGKRVVVEEGHGAFLDARRKRLVTAALLQAPVIDPSFGTVHTTARQQVELVWDHPAERDVTAYRVEVARDTSFVDLVKNEDVSSPTVTTPILAEGDYHWRVAAIDQNGLQGYASEPGRLTVVKDMRVDIKCEGPVEKRGPRLIAGGETFFRPVPRAESTSVVRYEYSVNGSPFRPVDEGIRLTRDGRFDVRVRGVAADDDVGEETALVAWIDATGPRVTLDVSPPFEDAKSGQMVRAELTATDETGLDRIEVAVEKGDFALYEGPMVLPARKDHLLRFRAWDVLGNASPSMSFRVRGNHGG